MEPRATGLPSPAYPHAPPPYESEILRSDFCRCAVSRTRHGAARPMLERPMRLRPYRQSASVSVSPPYLCRPISVYKRVMSFGSCSDRDAGRASSRPARYVGYRLTSLGAHTLPLFQFSSIQFHTSRMLLLLAVPTSVVRRPSSC